VRENDEKLQILMVEASYLLTIDEQKDLIGALYHNTVIESLCLNFTGLNEENTELLCELLKKNTTKIHYLGLSTNPINLRGIQAVSACLRVNLTLWDLDLSCVKLGVEGMKFLVDGLIHNQTLETIHLNANEIGPEGFKDLATLLLNNETLLSLDVENNKAEDEGAFYLAEALKTNKTLISLMLGRNKITSVGMIALADALKTNTAVELLSLDNNLIDGTCCVQLAEMFACNSTLETMSILNQTETFTETQWKVVYEALMLNYSIEEFRIRCYDSNPPQLGKHLLKNRYNKQMRQQTLLKIMFSSKAKKIWKTKRLPPQIE
jgi:hypothetical protein